MKPRALKTYKILAVALTAAAGCTRASGSEPSVEPIKQEAQAQKIADPTPQEVASASAVPSSQLAASAPASPVPPASAASAPGQPTSETPALVALREELRAQKRESAIAQIPHFRPLCDKDGYPLVGNAATSKSEADNYQPSAFCHDIRQRAPK